MGEDGIKLIQKTVRSVMGNITLLQLVLKNGFYANLRLCCMMVPYLDYNSTTPVDQRVLDVMIPVFSDRFGNPSSVQHGTGRQAEDIVDEARKKVADAVGMRASDVIFTSGATEANNLAISRFEYGTCQPYIGRCDRAQVSSTDM